MMLSQKVGATAMNSVLTISRAILCILILIILLGILWSAGSMKAVEYMILAILVVCTAFEIYITRPNNKVRNSISEKVVFIIGVFTILVGSILKFFGVTRSPDVMFLLFILVPFAAAHFIRPGTR